MTAFTAGCEITEWIGLRRVHERRIGLCQGRWLSYGQPVPCWLVHPLDELYEAGLVTISETCGPLRRAALTDTGQDRYAQLCTKYGVPPCQPLQVPAPQFPTNPDRLPVDREVFRHGFRPDGPGSRSAPNTANGSVDANGTTFWCAE